MSVLSSLIYFFVFPSFLHNYLGQSWIAPQDEALGLELAVFTTSREFDGFEYRGWRLKVSEESKAESIRRHEDFSGRRGHGERGFPLGFRDQGRSGHRNQWELNCIEVHRMLQENKLRTADSLITMTLLKIRLIIRYCHSTSLVYILFDHNCVVSSTF